MSEEMPKEVLDALQTDPDLKKAGLVSGALAEGEALPPGPAALRDEATKSPSFEDQVQQAFFEFSKDMAQLNGLTVKNLYRGESLSERLSDVEAKLKALERVLLREQSTKSAGPFEDLPLG
jgi:hypothetical protein